jgi:hypothetical protein
MRCFFLSISLFVGAILAECQPLKSTDYGLRVMLSDVPKEQILSDIRFEDGVDEYVDVLRLDHVGPSLYPLLISSKMPIATDSLGILAVKLSVKQVEEMLRTIEGINPKMFIRKFDEVLIRVTYRFRGRNCQYYVTNRKVVCYFLSILEKDLLKFGDDQALNKFYSFVGNTELRLRKEDKIVWDCEK